MIYNFFNDYDDYVFDYENEKLNLDVEFYFIIILFLLDVIVVEDKDGNNSGESVEDVIILKYDIIYVLYNGFGEIYLMV